MYFDHQAFNHDILLKKNCLTDFINNMYVYKIRHVTLSLLSTSGILYLEFLLVALVVIQKRFIFAK